MSTTLAYVNLYQSGASVEVGCIHRTYEIAYEYAKTFEKDYLKTVEIYLSGDIVFDE